MDRIIVDLFASSVFEQFQLFVRVFHDVQRDFMFRIVDERKHLFIGDGFGGEKPVCLDFSSRVVDHSCGRL